MGSDFRAYLATLCSCALWSFNIIASKHLSEAHISPVAISMWRWLIAALVLFAFCFRSIVRYFGVVWQHRWLFLVLGFWGVAMANTLLYYAAHSTAAINLGLLSATGPIFILIFSYLLLGESLSRRKIIGSIISIVGIVILITHGDLFSLTSVDFAVGDVLMLVMLIAVGIFTVLSKKKPVVLPSLVFLFYTFVVGFVLLVPIYFIIEVQYIPSYSWQHWGELLFLGLGPSLLAFITWNYAIQMVGPVMVAMLYFSVPVFVSLLAIFVLGESFAWYHFCGIIVLGFGVVYSVWEAKK